MKKMVIAILLVASTGMNVYAQKYLTRTGRISFFSSTPLENIEAINNEVAGVLDAKTGEVAFIVPIKNSPMVEDVFSQRDIV